MDDIHITTTTVGEYDGVVDLTLPSDTILYQFIVSGKLYQEIKGHAENWWSENGKAASDPSGYSAGIKECPSLNGAISEVVVATAMYDVENSIQAKKHDGGWDYEYKKETYDVKTTGMPYSVWITTSDVKNNQRVRYQMNADWYVAVHEDSQHLNEGWMAGTVLGRVSKQVILDNTKIEPGKRSEKKRYRHFVRKVSFSLLEPMPAPADLSALIS